MADAMTQEEETFSMIDLTPTIRGQVYSWAVILRYGDPTDHNRTVADIVRIIAQLMRLNPADKWPTGDEVTENWRLYLSEDKAEA